MQKNTLLLMVSSPKETKFVYILLGFMYGKGKKEEICCNPSKFICFTLWYFFLALQLGQEAAKKSEQ